ncbi:sensor histidine kinase [Kutzneria sp. 744]|uniref:sensor histidine kinase n=1 Tax=Kutzneria sp. (strain 744) TaxID=345341 RepID=UPI0003EEC8BB|nr:histidine kinase [Kutzneria sp. 744]EWM18881.1 signal transduction histidine kinase [Kutzneria sp. 744]
MVMDVRPPPLRRLRPGHWFALDCVAAVAVAVVWGGPLLGGHSEAAPASRWVGLLGATVLAVPLILRRRWPWVAFGLSIPLFDMSLATSVVPVVPFASVPMAVVAYSVAARGSRRAYGGLAVILVVVAVAAAVWNGQWVTVLLPGAVVVIGWGVGLLRAQYHAYAEALAAQREREAEALVADERLRIARELHDVVAHSMSVITVQADMGRLVFDRKPAVAAAALGVIETTGRDALAELRRMLGVLRDTESRGVLGPAPGLARLDGLVARTAAAGVNVDVVVRGTPRPLPAGVDVSAYRIVQEALTNVVKHAGTPTCRVTVVYGQDAVLLTVTDDGRGGPPRPGGHGLVGMRERAALCGGELRAGPTPSGFEVAARLPDGARR